MGTRYCIDGGEETLLEDAGCPKGTTILVRDLFYNTPARMKFLKKDVSEANAVASAVDRIALSHPEVSVKFIRDGKQERMTPGDGKLLSTIHAVFGRQFAQGLLPVDYTLDGVKVSGYIMQALRLPPQPRMQTFHQRPVCAHPHGGGGPGGSLQGERYGGKVPRLRAQPYA